ncbi:MAG: hypothetical protein ACO3NU_09535, partial [Arenicellales bacterium]
RIKEPFMFVMSVENSFVRNACVNIVRKDVQWNKIEEAISTHLARERSQIRLIVSPLKTVDCLSRASGMFDS